MNRQEMLQRLVRQVVNLSLQKRYVEAERERLERDRLLREAAEMRELAEGKTNPAPCLKAANRLEREALALAGI